VTQIPLMQSIPDLPPGLYLLATPIGNLRDITLRALDVLGSIDVLYCEDTRVTGGLVSHFGLKVKLAVYDDHRADKVEAGIIDAIKSGRRVGLCSDAGLPLISDPGFRLIRAAAKEGLYVTSIPGANAALTALQLSGIPTDSFAFHGFLPPKTSARKDRLAQLAAVTDTLVFYETGPRLADALTDMAAVLGERQGFIARELTKKFETLYRGTLSELIPDSPPKGEIVIVVAGADVTTGSDADNDKILSLLLPHVPTKVAADIAADLTGAPRKALYERALKLK
jgi:16S rRNA (cytidine1402-2'-O)-methyltransferase